MNECLQALLPLYLTPDGGPACEPAEIGRLAANTSAGQRNDYFNELIESITKFMARPARRSRPGMPKPLLGGKHPHATRAVAGFPATALDSHCLTPERHG